MRNAIHQCNTFLTKKCERVCIPVQGEGFAKSFQQGGKKKRRKKNKKAFYDLQTPNNHDGRKVGR